MTDQAILDCYERTRALWRSLEGQFRTWPCRYAILYGPAELEPELFFVGINPGYSADTLYDEEILRPPEQNEYVNADWRLATRLRSMFGALGHAKWLDHSNGSNTIFFKSEAIKTDRARPDGYFWNQNPVAIRRQLEAFSLLELRGLVRHLRPKRIVALGLEAFSRIGTAEANALISPKGRRLALTGTVGSTPLFGMIHPTGAQVASEDRERVLDHMGKWLAVAR